jgi:hypothetical protein
MARRRIAGSRHVRSERRSPHPLSALHIQHVRAPRYIPIVTSTFATDSLDRTRPRMQIRYVVACTCPPLASCLSQHSPTRGEWSSPSELIHPGE